MSLKMSTGNSHKYVSDLEGKILFKKIKTLYMILFSLKKYKQNCVVYIWYYSLGILTGSRTVGRLCWLQRLQQLFKWLDNDISHFLNSSVWSWIAFLPVWLRPCWIKIKILKTSSPALETSSTSIQLPRRCKSEVINCLSSLLKSLKPAKSTNCRPCRDT